MRPDLTFEIHNQKVQKGSNDDIYFGEWQALPSLREQIFVSFQCTKKLRDKPEKGNNDTTLGSQGCDTVSCSFQAMISRSTIKLFDLRFIKLHFETLNGCPLQEDNIAKIIENEYSSSNM